MCTLIIYVVVAGTAMAVGPYTDNGDGTVTDVGTGLVWQQSDDGTTRNWPNALAYCGGLNLGGFTDWRLPNYLELSSIVKYDTYNPAIDTLVFDCRSSFYLSATTDACDTGSAWGVYFDNGYDGWYHKADSVYVRCVRAGLNQDINRDNNLLLMILPVITGKNSR